MLLHLRLGQVMLWSGPFASLGASADCGIIGAILWVLDSLCWGPWEVSMGLPLPLAVPLRRESEEAYSPCIKSVCASSPSLHLPTLFRLREF